MASKELIRFTPFFATQALYWWQIHLKLTIFVNKLVHFSKNFNSTTYLLNKDYVKKKPYHFNPKLFCEITQFTNGLEK